MKRKKSFVLQREFLRFLFISFIFLLSACSNLTKRKSLFGSESHEKMPSQTVSREEYNQLLEKYKILLKSNKLGAGNVSKLESPDIVAGLISNMGAIPAPELAETVDVFGDKEGQIKFDHTKRSAPTIGEAPSTSEVEREIKILKKANALVDQNKHGQAVALLKSVENSSTEHIKVHAKFLLGELFFRQKSYDLSMQIFEDIIKSYSFSGLVLKSLGRLIVCCEKLKLIKKKDQYYSILHDFFGENA